MSIIGTGVDGPIQWLAMQCLNLDGVNAMLEKSEFGSCLSYLSSVPISDFSGAAHARTPPLVESAEYNCKLVAASGREGDNLQLNPTHTIQKIDMDCHQLSLGVFNGTFGFQTSGILDYLL
jgi:hypothetical protein